MQMMRAERSGSCNLFCDSPTRSLRWGSLGLCIIRKNVWNAHEKRLNHCTFTLIKRLRVWNPSKNSGYTIRTNWFQFIKKDSKHVWAASLNLQLWHVYCHFIAFIDNFSFHIQWTLLQCCQTDMPSFVCRVFSQNLEKAFDEISQIIDQALQQKSSFIRMSINFRRVLIEKQLFFEKTPSLVKDGTGFAYVTSSWTFF